jgi:protein-disulfide isomerase
MPRFEKAMASAETAAAVDRDIAEGNRNAVPGTPSFYVNGKRTANYEIATLRDAISAALAAANPGK